ncbi:MAG: hypothetical protein ABI433_00585 [Burkholderiaceae bacterium]
MQSDTFEPNGRAETSPIERPPALLKVHRDNHDPRAPHLSGLRCSAASHPPTKRVSGTQLGPSTLRPQGQAVSGCARRAKNTVELAHGDQQLLLGHVHATSGEADVATLGDSGQTAHMPRLNANAGGSRYRKRPLHHRYLNSIDQSHAPGQYREYGCWFWTCVFTAVAASCGALTSPECPLDVATAAIVSARC